VLFWMWKLRLPQRRHRVWDLLRRFPKLGVPFVCTRKHRASRGHAKGSQR